MTDQVIGFVGLGRMGGPMAGRLIKAGHEVVVFDTSSSAVAALTEAGAVSAASPEDVGVQADIVIVSLPTPDIVTSVVLGDKGVAKGSRVKIVIDLSTSGPGMAGRVSAALSE